MNNRFIKILILIFSIIFAVRVLTVFTADRLYSMSLAAIADKITTEKGTSLLETAEKLDSGNANLYFEEFKLLEDEIAALKKEKSGADKIKTYRKRQIFLLKKAIDLCPSWPVYHMYYALTIKRMSTKSNIITDSKILSEMEKAVELKPFSKVYSNIYKKYHKNFIKKYTRATF